MGKQHDKQFKLDALRYCEDHKELGLRGCVDLAIMLLMSRKELPCLDVNFTTHRMYLMYFFDFDEVKLWMISS